MNDYYEVTLEEYIPHQHGGYALKMLGELYDSQAKLFTEGCQIQLGDPVADISSHNVDLIFYKGKRVGIILSAPSGIFEETMSIADIIIEKEYRNLGIGRKALKILISKAVADGAKHISLNVSSNNQSAVHLYESMGFKTQSQWMVKQV